MNAVNTRVRVAELWVKVRVGGQRGKLFLPVRLLVLFPHIDLELEIDEGDSPILRLFLLYIPCCHASVILYHSDYIQLCAINLLS